jgi:hypothetical protein
MLLAATRHDRDAWALHKKILLDGAIATVPAVVVAQVWRSGRQAALARLLAGCSEEDFTSGTARLVGSFAAGTRHSDVVDLAVAAGAVARGDRVVTSDPGDLVAAGVDPKLIVAV